ncbi:rRNA-processing protein las1 [Blastocladiella emersonii ATCC 22665]|nr:rRNA-processing protein las1 [Blastocladiella emersonii ATCC 22665]
MTSRPAPTPPPGPRPTLRLVPWVDDDEWAETRDWLYSHTDPALQWRGVGRCKVWLSRGRVPQSAQATGALLEVALRDASGALHESELRALYSLAVLRFVNGLVDLEQKRAFAMPITGIAGRLGLPHDLVDLRHQATHGAVPSLGVLRRACADSLAWLWERYWNVQTNRLAEARDEVNDALTAYKKQRKEQLRGPTSAAAQRDRPNPEDAVATLVDTLAPRSITQIVIPALVETGCLVPKLESARPKFPKDLAPNHFRLWLPALTVIQRAHDYFLGELLTAILERLLDSVRPDELPSSTDAALYAWFKHLVALAATDAWWSTAAAGLPLDRWRERIPEADHPMTLMLLVVVGRPTHPNDALTARAHDLVTAHLANSGTTTPTGWRARFADVDRSIRAAFNTASASVKRRRTNNNTSSSSRPSTPQPAPPPTAGIWTLANAEFNTVRGNLALGLLPSGQMSDLSLPYSDDDEEEVGDGES